jgi:hypothetical protein
MRTTKSDRCISIRQGPLINAARVNGQGCPTAREAYQKMLDAGVARPVFYAFSVQGMYNKPGRMGNHDDTGRMGEA